MKRLTIIFGIVCLCLPALGQGLAFDILEREYRKRSKYGHFSPYSLSVIKNNTVFPECQSVWRPTIPKITPFRQARRSGRSPGRR